MIIVVGRIRLLNNRNANKNTYELASFRCILKLGNILTSGKNVIVAKNLGLILKYLIRLSKDMIQN